MPVLDFTLFDKLQSLVEDKVEYQSFCTHSYGGPVEHHFNLKKRIDGINLEISAKAVTLLEAIASAIEKWNRIVNGGISEFKGPLIEGPKPIDLDDDLPF